jgi:hypothetical protein
MVEPRPLDVEAAIPDGLLPGESQILVASGAQPLVVCAFRIMGHFSGRSTIRQGANSALVTAEPADVTLAHVRRTAAKTNTESCLFHLRASAHGASLIERDLLAPHSLPEPTEPTDRHRVDDPFAAAGSRQLANWFQFRNLFSIKTLVFAPRSSPTATILQKRADLATIGGLSVFRRLGFAQNLPDRKTSENTHRRA